MHLFTQSNCMNLLTNAVVTLFSSHQTQRTQQTIIISSDSDSEAQFTLGHPLQHGSILTGSEDIYFSHFWRNKGHMANRAEDPQINHHSISHLLDSFEPPFWKCHTFPPTLIMTTVTLGNCHIWYPFPSCHFHTLVPVSPHSGR